MGASSRCKLFMRIFSFERTNAQRTVALARGGWRRFGRCHAGLVVAYGFQKCHGRSKKKASRDGAAEIEQPVVVAGRLAHEHIFEHLFNGMGRTAVADEVGAELTVSGPADRHVVPQGLDFFPVLEE